ncbi:hypothetical protein BDR06DRAFT_948326 [Suillus hirtellus]|nr:hypothetical protein BDR06DRAFT_948326 [Suillus hirtellus]
MELALLLLLPVRYPVGCPEPHPPPTPCGLQSINEIYPWSNLMMVKLGHRSLVSQPLLDNHYLNSPPRGHPQLHFNLKLRYLIQLPTCPVAIIRIRHHPILYTETHSKEDQARSHVASIQHHSNALRDSCASATPERTIEHPATCIYAVSSLWTLWFKSELQHCHGITPKLIHVIIFAWAMLAMLYCCTGGV